MTKSPQQAAQSVLIGDAGVIIGFMLGKKFGLLHKVCKVQGYVLQVPAHVEFEVRRVLEKLDRSNPKQSLASWAAIKKSGSVEVIKDPAVNSPVAKSVTDYLGVMSGSSTTSDKDLGEYYVISHAVDLRDKGFTVAVAIDDGRGRDLARARQLEVITTEHLIDLAVNQDLFTSQIELKECYDGIGKFSTLRPFADTFLEAHQQKREDLR